jgi:GntR family transcriptional regulator
MHARAGLANAQAHSLVDMLYHNSDTLVLVIFTINPSSTQPLYLQVMQQIRHAIDTGVLQPGDPLPGVRTLAQQLVVSPNTIVKAYTELEHEDWLESRHGSGAYVKAKKATKARTDRVRHAQLRVRAVVNRLREEGFSDDEIQRLVEAALFYAAPAGVKP